MFRHNTQILTIGKSGSASDLMLQDIKRQKKQKKHCPLLIYNSMLRTWVFVEGFINIQDSITL